MIGRSTVAAMARTTASVNVPPCAETPISIVGLAFFTTSSSPILPGCSHVQPATSLGRLRERRLEIEKAGHAFDQQPVAVDGVEPAARLGLRKPGIDHRALSSAAMPQPAEPAPTMAIRCSANGTPVTFTAASSVPAQTAAVPWMSSLKVQSRSR